MADNSTPFKRLRRTFVLGFACAFILQSALSASETVTSSRVYRDFMGYTPFSDVTVYISVVDATGITLTGEMKKRGCTFDTNGSGLVGYAKFDNQAKVRIPVDTSVEDGIIGKENTTRPVSNELEQWGPWYLEYVGSTVPDDWEIHAGHWCPLRDSKGIIIYDTETYEPLLKFETNLFASGEWKNVRN